MRTVLIIAVVLFLAGVATACLFWAGVSVAAGWAGALGGLGIGFGIVVLITQLGNWGVPGDEPPLLRHGKH